MCINVGILTTSSYANVVGFFRGGKLFIDELRGAGPGVRGVPVLGGRP